MVANHSRGDGADDLVRRDGDDGDVTAEAVAEVEVFLGLGGDRVRSEQLRSEHGDEWREPRECRAHRPAAGEGNCRIYGPRVMAKDSEKRTGIRDTVVTGWPL